MPFNIKCIKVVYESNIRFATHIYKSAVYFTCFTIQLSYLEAIGDMATVFFSDFSDCAKLIIGLDS